MASKLLMYENNQERLWVYKANLSGPVWCVTPHSNGGLLLSERRTFKTRSDAIQAAKKTLGLLKEEE